MSEQIEQLQQLKKDMEDSMRIYYSRLPKKIVRFPKDPEKAYWFGRGSMLKDLLAQPLFRQLVEAKQKTEGT